MVDYAAKQEVSLLVSPHDTATTAMLCRSAISVKHMIHEEFVTLRDDESLVSAERTATASNFQAFPVVDDDGRTIGILSKSDFLKKVNRRLILVDHNELSQAVQGADQVEIMEIIDHHRIGALTNAAADSVPERTGSARRAPSWQILFSVTVSRCRRRLRACCSPDWFRIL
jgi:manganese-dependent inorganic pyrophosphatase